MSVHILGIKHHGVWSSKKLKNTLLEIKPDLVLIEGPEIANDLIHFSNNKEMNPPVAILIYDEEDLKNYTFYPFAIFSPEWQALLYSFDQNIPAYFIDLNVISDSENSNLFFSENIDSDIDIDNLFQNKNLNLKEQDKDIYNTENVYEQIKILFSELRKNYYSIPPNILLREAYMKRNINKYKMMGFKNIVVICGALHSPELDKDLTNYDIKLLDEYIDNNKNYKSIWIPWSYNNFHINSAYGLGLQSPNWNEHIWNTNEDIAVNFIIKATKILKEYKINISSADIIDTTKLSFSLAKIRGKEEPDLDEILESIKSTMCFGNKDIISLISTKLLIGSNIGKIPTKSPKVLIQTDFINKMNDLKINLNFSNKVFSLNIINNLEKKRSEFFYQLDLLDLPFSKANFDITEIENTKENWSFKLEEGWEIYLIEKSIWGNSIKEATINYIEDKISTSNNILSLTTILLKSIGANLDDLSTKIISRIQHESINLVEIEKFILILPVIIQSYKYLNIKNLDREILEKLIISIFYTIDRNLSNYIVSFDQDNIDKLIKNLETIIYYLNLIKSREYVTKIYSNLEHILIDENLNPTVSGYICSLLFYEQFFSINKTKDYMTYFLISENELFKSSFWLQGFLKKSTILINNLDLLDLLNDWISTLNYDQFINSLPILKKVFSKFSIGEKNNITNILFSNILQKKDKENETFDPVIVDKSLDVLKNIFKRKIK